MNRTLCQSLLLDLLISPLILNAMVREDTTLNLKLFLFIESKASLGLGVKALKLEAEIVRCAIESFIFPSNFIQAIYNLWDL